MIPVRMADSRGLLLLAKDADRYARNRRANLPLLEKHIDLAGCHLAVLVLLHEHIAGRRADPHYRTLWFVKLEDREEPEQIWLDVSMDLLHKVTELLPNEAFDPGRGSCEV